MRGYLRFVGLCVVLSASLLFHGEVNAGLGRAVARGAERSAARAVEKAAFRSLRRVEARSAARTAGKLERAALVDRVRDAGTTAKVLKKPRLAFRYVNDRKLATELRRGFPRNTHFTSAAGPGRPLSSKSALLRFGLPKSPTSRISARLPAGQSVRFNKVVGGNKAGLGEISLGRSMSSGQVRRVVKLPAPKSKLGSRLFKTQFTKRIE